MKPVELVMKGFNSFKEQQAINFERLTEKGFFGIFGPTGSGKSSILDAMTYALYGKIVRDNKGFINVTEDVAKVSYTFEIGAGAGRKKYRVERGTKRDKNGAYKTHIAKLIEIKDGTETILEEKATEVNNRVKDIIGLEMGDFTRAVVLPQGKFSEFLKAVPKERRDMLERIFGLDRYGSKLIGTIKGASIKNRIQLQGLEGQLREYTDVSKEALGILKEQHEELENRKHEASASKKQLDEAYEKMKRLHDLSLELSEKKKNWEQLKEREPRVKSMKARLESGERFLKVKPFIVNKDDCEKKLEMSEEELVKSRQQCQVLSQELSESRNEHDQAAENKNKLLPELLKRENQLKAAVELKKKYMENRREVEQLQARMDHMKKNIEGKQESIEQLNGQLEEKQVQLSKIAESMAKLEVQPEYKEKITKALQTEREHKEARRQFDEANAKKLELENNLKHEEAQFEKIAGQSREMKEELEKLKEKATVHRKECPGDRKTLMLENRELGELQQLLSRTRDICERKSSLEESMAAADKERNQISQQLEQKKKEIAEMEKQLFSAEKKLEDMNKNNMAAILASGMRDGEPCPVCGGIHRIKMAEPMDEKLLSEAEAQVQYTKKIVEESRNAASSMAAMEKVKFQQLAELNDAIRELDHKLQGNEVEVLKQKVQEAESKVSRLDEAISLWEKEEKLSSEQLQERERSFNELSTRIAGLEAKVMEQRRSFEVLKEDVESRKIKLDTLEEQCKRAMLQFAVESFEAESERLTRMDRELFKERKAEGILREETRKHQELVAAMESEKVSLTLEFEKTAQSIKEKSDVMKGQYDELAAVSKGRKLEELLDETEEAIVLMNQREEKAKEELEQCMKKKNEADMRESSAQKEKETLENMLKEHGKKLQEALSKNEFQCQEDAEKWSVEEGELESMRVEVKEHEEASMKLSSALSDLERKLGGETLDEEQWTGLLQEKDEMERMLTETIELCSKKKQQLEDMERKLKKVRELVEERDEIQHKQAILDKLEKLVKGNKMVDFVARGQLKYVAAEASRRLMSITGNEYALELSDDGEFVIRDNFNGGNLRSTDSLSGGETFLTSFSLALALSSHIQLRGSAPLEFFFLDEGFGTLDNELLDKVMNSLEMLRKEKLSVGIISHVEELQSRVPMKLMVVPAGVGEGSKVKIENN